MAILADDKVFLRDKRLGDTLRQRGFGEQKSSELVLDLFEALYLMEKEKFTISEAKEVEAITAEALIKYSSKKVKNFYLKYQVFFDLRDSRVI